VAGTQAVQAHVRGGNPNGSGSVRAQTEIGSACGDGGRGAAGRAAGQMSGCGWIAGGTVMRIGTGQAVGELVGVVLAHWLGAGRAQSGYRVGIRVGRRMGGQPARMTGTCRKSGHVDNVFDRQASPGQWSFATGRSLGDRDPRDERIDTHREGSACTYAPPFTGPGSSGFMATQFSDLARWSYTTIRIGRLLEREAVMSVTLDRRMSPQQVSKAIRDDVIRRVFEPGQRLTEDSLAEWCGGLVAAYRLQERGSGHAS
jgi:hypothetical protein